MAQPLLAQASCFTAFGRCPRLQNVPPSPGAMMAESQRLRPEKVPHARTGPLGHPHPGLAPHCGLCGHLTGPLPEVTPPAVG